MTAHEAKALSLEVWQYLAEHPEIKYKRDLPKAIFSKIEKLENTCPLCELYYDDYSGCPECPLEDCTYFSLYGRWCYCSKDERQSAAQAIVNKIKAWEPKEINNA